MATLSPPGASDYSPPVTAAILEYPGRRRTPGIPVSLTPFVGRETEIAHLCAMITDEQARLVTLTGPGGVGKTRLAVQVATALRGRFPDGSGFADLAVLSPDQSILPSLAQALGYRDPPDSLELDKLVSFVGDRHMLLIVDNFEHLMSRAADLAYVLSRCPNLVVLVTSRVVLRISGEREFSVSPLGLGVGVSDSLETIAASPAVKLFVDRAKAARSDFELTTGNAVSVVKICRRLDGLPLAIELAAARVRALPVEGLEARLEHRLEMLSRGPRDYPERQQTMRCTIGWSYDLLGPGEQTLFGCFSVFAGGCTLDPLESLAVEYGYTPESAFEAVSALVEASLVIVEEDSSDSQRYRMLDTIRDFASERLQQGQFADTTPRWHARYFHAYVQAVAPPPFEPSDRALVAPIEQELDNIRAALAWMERHGEGEMLLETAAAMYDAWYYRGYFDECERWMERALELAPDDAPVTQRAWAHKALGTINQIKGNESAASRHYRKSLDLYDCCGDKRARAVVSNIYAGFLVGNGHYDEAKPVFEQNKQFFKDSGDDVWHSHALFHLGVIAFGQGDSAAAMDYCREAVDVYDRTGGRLDAIDPLRYVMLAAIRKGDLAAARLAGLDNLQRLRERGSLEPIAGGIADTAAYAVAKREWETAATLLGAANSVRESQGAAFTLPARAAYDHAEHVSRRRLGDEQFDAAWRVGELLGAMEALDAAVRMLEDAGRAAQAVDGNNPLTDREQDVLRMLATGASNPEIAEELFISRGTVRTHVSSILGKLNVHTRTEAVSRAHREGWI